MLECPEMQEEIVIYSLYRLNGSVLTVTFGHRVGYRYVPSKLGFSVDVINGTIRRHTDNEIVGKFTTIQDIIPDEWFK